MTTSPVCQGCNRPLEGRQKKWCADPDCKRAAVRWAWILKVYGLTPGDYERIYAHQGGKCAICHKAFRPDKTPHIDHEHGGHVRGILCAYCNTRLVGRLKSHQLAQWLADYLRAPPAVEALGRLVIAPGRPKTKRRKRR
jgi:DNA-directed RNA polymerase subunit RPC12/RpoP